MSIIKDKLKVKNSNDVIYPYTSIDQVENLSTIIKREHVKRYKVTLTDKSSGTNALVFYFLLCNDSWIRVNADNEINTDGYITSIFPIEDYTEPPTWGDRSDGIPLMFYADQLQYMVYHSNGMLYRQKKFKNYNIKLEKLAPSSNFLVRSENGNNIIQ